jgi:pimeloyl-ACP methyl ester carboxylesterase
MRSAGVLVVALVAPLALEACKAPEPSARASTGAARGSAKSTPPVPAARSAAASASASTAAPTSAPLASTRTELAIAPAPPPAAPALAPLDGPEMLSFKLDDGGEAFVVVPLGATSPRPVILGVHGAGDRHDWSCVEWQASARRYPFVVCPRGVPTSKEFYAWGSPDLIVKRAEKALALVKDRYPAYVADGPVLYGGWSQGAMLTAQVVSARPGLFERVIMIEIGHTPLDANGVGFGLKAGAVTRAVVSCSSPPCRGKSRELAKTLPRYGVAVEQNDVGDRGHWFDDPVFKTLGPKIGWVTEGDPRWDGLRDILAREDGDAGP